MRFQGFCSFVVAVAIIADFNIAFMSRDSRTCVLNPNTSTSLYSRFRGTYPSEAEERDKKIDTLNASAEAWE